MGTIANVIKLGVYWAKLLNFKSEKEWCGREIIRVEIGEIDSGLELIRCERLFSWEIQAISDGIYC